MKTTTNRSIFVVEKMLSCKKLIMFNFSILSLACIFILLINVPTGNGFKCYVCDSKSDNECDENLPRNSRLKPQDCIDLIEPKYCVKTTNMYAGELGTKRFCAANDHGNYCRYVKQPTGDQELRSCVFTCNSENCNSAFGSKSLITNLPLYTTVLSILYYCLL